MRKHLATLIISILSFAVSTSAQSIKWGPSIELEAKIHSELNVHKLGPEGYYTILYDGENGKKTIIVEKYDLKMKKKFSQKVFDQASSKENKKAIFIHSIELTDGILLIFKDKKKKKGVYEVFGIKVDFQGNISQDRFEISRQYSSSVYLDFDIIATDDGGFITFEYTTYPSSVRKKMGTNMKEFTTFIFKKFDKDCSVKQESLKNLPGLKSKYRLLGIPYNQKSKVFYGIITQAQSYAEKKGKSKLDEKINTLVLIPEDEELKALKLKNQDEQHGIYSSLYAVDNNGSLVKYSTYMNKEDKNITGKKKKQKLEKTLGYYIQVWDKDMEPIGAYDIPYTDAVLKIAMGSKSYNKNPEDRFALRQQMRQIITDDEGNQHIFSEYYYHYVTTRTVRTGNTTTTETTHHYIYGDVIVSKVSPEGELISMNIVPKHQYTIEDNGVNSGYYATLVNGKPRIFWREHATNVPYLEKWDNADEDEEEENNEEESTKGKKDTKEKKKKKDNADRYKTTAASSKSDAGIIMASFGEDGTVSYKMVEKTLKNQPVFHRWDNYYHPEVGVMFVGRDKKKTRVGLLNLSSSKEEK